MHDRVRYPAQDAEPAVPTDAIIFNRNGMKVAVVSDGKAEIRKVRWTPFVRQPEPLLKV